MYSICMQEESEKDEELDELEECILIDVFLKGYVSIIHLINDLVDYGYKIEECIGEKIVISKSGRRFWLMGYSSKNGYFVVINELMNTQSFNVLQFSSRRIKISNATLQRKLEKDNVVESE